MPRPNELTRNRYLSDVVAEMRKPKKQAETGWHQWGASSNDEENIPFMNNWGAAGVGAPWAPVSYHISEDGEVRLRGHIDGGDVGTTVAVLPEGARPEYAMNFLCPTDDGGKAVVRIDPDGSVVVTSITT